MRAAALGLRYGPGIVGFAPLVEEELERLEKGFKGIGA
jgi:hypothetical protein